MKRSIRAASVAFIITITLLAGLWAFALADLNVRQNSVLGQPPAFSLSVSQYTAQVELLGQTSQVSWEQLGPGVGFLRQFRALIPHSWRMAPLLSQAVYDRWEAYDSQRREQEFINTLLLEGF